MIPRIGLWLGLDPILLALWVGDVVPEKSSAVHNRGRKIAVRGALRALSILVLLTLGLSPQGVAQELDLSGLSPEAMLEEADERIDRMEGTLAEVRELRDRTQEEDQDLTKVRCLNDKIAAIQGFLRLSGDSRESLSELRRQPDREAIEHQYTLVVIASQRVQGLRSEALQCAGDILTFAGDTEQSATVDSDIPDSEGALDADLANAALNRLMSDTPLTEATPFQ